MKPEELRQLRAWAVEAALGKASMDKVLYESANHRTEKCERTMAEVISDARELEQFVRDDS